MFNEYPDILTPEQLAKALKISKNSAYRLINEKKIGSIHVGRKIIIPKSCLIDYTQAARFTVDNQ